MPRRRRKGAGSYPTFGGGVDGLSAAGGGDGSFAEQPDLGGPPAGGGGAEGMSGGIYIQNINTAIAQAINEQGGGGVMTGPITGPGPGTMGGTMMMTQMMSPMKGSKSTAYRRR